ncbi:MAG: ankyrin repeat domain-containing protein, partial [bacterium]
MPNSNGFTCLHIAAKEGYLDMCRRLMAIGCDPNIRDKYGFSAAYWAKENRHKDVMD